MNILRRIKEYLLLPGKSPKKIAKEYEQEIRSIDEYRKYKRSYWKLYYCCVANIDYSKYEKSKSVL